MSGPPRPGPAFGRFLRRAPAPPPPAASVMGAAGIVAIGFVGSRLLGIVRSIAIADAFGTEPELAAYWVAFRLPDLVFQLVAGGTVSAAFIPVFSQVLLREGDAGAWRLASRILNLVAVATFVLAALAFAFAPLLVPVLAPGLAEGSPREAELRALAVDLTRLMLVSPLLFSVSGMVTGILNARRHFLAPALAPMLYNLSIILGAVVLGGPLGVRGLAWGVVAGALAHLVVQLPVLGWMGLRWSPSLGLDSRPVRDVARLMGPRVVGLAASQVNFLVLIFFASFVSDAAISAITFAFMMMMLPVGVSGMAISTAAFPVLAQQAASLQFQALGASIARGLRSILFVAVPASVGLALLAEPVVRVLLERGAFDRDSSELVATALAVFAVGIAGHAGIEILSRGFYALSDTRTPVQIAVVAMLLNVALAAALVPLFELRGLAAAASITALVECLALGVMLRRRVDLGAGVWPSLLRTLLASAVAGEVIVVMRVLLDGAGIAHPLAVLAAAGGAGALSYLALSLAVHREALAGLVDRGRG